MAVTTDPTSATLTEHERQELEARFHDNVALDRATGCINWTASTDRNGYGQFRVGKKMLRAHRVAYALAYGPIPARQMVRHTCLHNRRCVNTLHLVLGTHQENMDDMAEAGHTRSGLTNADVAIIFGLKMFGQSDSEIADQFPVSVDMIRLILKAQRRCGAIAYELDKVEREQALT